MTTTKSGQLTEDEFFGYFLTFKRWTFRLEALPSYDVAAHSGRLRLYFEGKPLPPESGDDHDFWREVLVKARQDGRRVYRVHVVPHKLTPYLRYEIEWGYLPHAELGEEIMLLRTEEPERVIPEWNGHDFWLFDDEAAIRLHYDDAGVYLYPELITDQPLIDRYLKIRDAAVAQATPLQKYLAEVRNP